MVERDARGAGLAEVAWDAGRSRSGAAAIFVATIRPVGVGVPDDPSAGAPHSG